ncbi:MAG: hypothetical protein DHS20C19_12680 [Acidimicrobiales bacterium]|nr:MAG: hypothetical protein DHS20C19_12680 [Acidimicrobiales bacterium]
MVVGAWVVMKKVRGDRYPTVAVAVLTGARNAPTLIEEFALVPQGEDLSARVTDLGSAFSNRVEGLNADVVVVRRADRPQRPSNTEGPRERLLAEGALAYAAASSGADVVLLCGRDLASQAGTSKASLDEEAEAMFGSGPKESVAAALAVLGV